MSRTGMPARAISVLLAFALACTMVPATSLAYAAPADSASTSASESAQPQNDAVENATSTTDMTNDESAAANAESAQDAVAAERVNQDVPVAAQSGNADQATEADVEEATVPAVRETASTTEDLDMLSASVSLNNAEPILSYNGLTYTVNEDAQSVTLTGWTGTAPKDALYIPSQVVVGSTTYKVTAVNKVRGGGVHC